jgi:hypothetical protein
MMGSMVMLLLLIAIIGGVALWVQQSRSQPHPAGDSAEGLRTNRVSLLTEAVGYVGTILVLAGAGAAVGQHWEDIGSAGRLAILGTATLIFLGVGWLVRSSAEPAYRRLTSVTWAVSTAAFAGTVAVVNEVYDTSDKTTFLTVATATTVYAAVLWLVHQRAIQQAVLLVGILVSTAAVVVRMVDEPDPWMIAVPLWAIGLAWAAAGWLRRLAPWFVAVPLGVFVGLIAPSAVGEPSALRFGLGIGTGVTVMALSVWARFTPGLAMASVALLGYVVGAVSFYFGDTLGVPASLTIAGLLILALAAVSMRWHWFSRKQLPAAEPPSPDAETSSPPVEHHHAA